MFFLVKKNPHCCGVFHVIIESVDIMQTIRDRVKDRIGKAKQNVEVFSTLSAGQLKEAESLLDESNAIFLNLVKAEIKEAVPAPADNKNVDVLDLIKQIEAYDQKDSSELINALYEEAMTKKTYGDALDFLTPKYPGRYGATIEELIAVNWLNFDIYEARRKVMDHIKTLKIGDD